MATSYTTLLGFALPVTGELQGTWGDTVNNSITQLCEDSIAGVATASVLSADWTLTTTGSGAANQSRMAILIPTGSPGVSRNIIAPSKSKTYTVINQSNAAVVIKGAATAGVTIAAGDTVVVAWNGSDFVAVKYASNSYTNLTVSGSLTLSGGTANGVAYLNGSKVLTSGSALYFDGTNLGIGTTSVGEKLTVNGNIASPADAYLYSYTGGSVGTVSSGIRLIGSTSTAIFITASLERMRIDASGNLGLGVTPSAWYSGSKTLQFTSGSIHPYGSSFNITNNSYIDSSQVYRYVSDGYASMFRQNNGQYQWFTAPSGTAGNAISFTQAMTLDASGTLLIGTTSGFIDTALTLARGTAATWSVGPSISNGNGGNFYVINNASVGVYLASGNAAWASNSDERLKTGLKPIEDAVNKISTLRAVTGRYKTDKEEVSRSFLIAQDVQAVLPEAVNVQDDEIGTLGVQYTDTIPLLVAAIKELKAELDELKSQLGK